MENKKIRLFAFGAMAIMLLTVPLMMIINSETVLREGRDFRFRTQPIDPYDPFRGKYIVLNFQQTMVEVPEVKEWTNGESIFLQVREDSIGFAQVFAPSKERPIGTDDYFEAEVEYALGGDKSIRVKFPFDRYYMEESKAGAAERIYFEMARDRTKEVYALVTVFQGEARLKNVYIDGESIKELAGNQE